SYMLTLIFTFIVLSISCLCLCLILIVFLISCPVPTASFTSLIERRINQHQHIRGSTGTHVRVPIGVLSSFIAMHVHLCLSFPASFKRAIIHHPLFSIFGYSQPYLLEHRMLCFLVVFLDL